MDHEPHDLALPHEFHEEFLHIGHSTEANDLRSPADIARCRMLEIGNETLKTLARANQLARAAKRQPTNSALLAESREAQRRATSLAKEYLQQLEAYREALYDQIRPEYSGARRVYGRSVRSRTRP